MSPLPSENQLRISALLISVFTLLAFLADTSRCKGSTDSPFRVWAIASDPSTQVTGFSDLLMVRMASKDFTLVERDLLRQIEREKFYQQLISGADKPDDISSTGKRLNADALIVLKTVEITADKNSDVGATLLRISIYSCSHGVRIGVIQIDSKKGSDQLDEVVDEIRNIRSRFDSGVRFAIAIPPFAIENIDKTYDSLSKKYHDLLSNSLSSLPGVAILDFENARTISVEFPDEELLRDRIIPLQVEVKYRVNETKAANPTISFEVRKISRGETKELQSGELQLQKASEWISTILPSLLLDFSDASRITPSKQIDLLKERADLLQKLGDFESAIACRESLLLLDSKNAEQRLKAVNEYRYLATLLCPVGQIRPKGFEIRSNVLEHLESLISAKLVHQEEVYNQLEFWLMFPHGNNRVVYERIPFDRKDNRALIDDDSLFLQRILPAYWELSRIKEMSENEKAVHIYQWSNLAWETLSRHVNLRYPVVNEMRYLFSTIAKIIPEDYPTAGGGAALVQTMPQDLHFARQNPREGTTTKQLDTLTEEDLRKLCNDLSKSKHLHLQMYGDLGLLWLDTLELRRNIDQLMEAKRSGAPPPTQVTREEVDKLTALCWSRINAIKSRPCVALLKQNKPLPYYDGTESGYYYLKRDIQRPFAIAQPLDQTPMKESTLGRLEFEPLPLDLSVFNSEPFKFVPGGPKFDFLFGSQNILRIEPDFTTKIIHKFEAYKRTLIWDGANLYIIPAAPEVPWEILTEEGQLQYTIDVNSLFPKSDRLEVFLAAPNQLLVIGRLEKDTRSWCAIAEFERNTFKVKIIHEGRRPIDFGRQLDGKNETWDLDWVLRPHTVGKYRHMGHDYLFISRDAGRPLRIDLETLKVSVLGLPPMGFSTPPICAENNLIFCLSTPCYFDLNTPDKQEMVRKQVITYDPAELKGIHPPGNNDSVMFEHDGWIYLPGYAWYRFTPSLDRIERLVPTSLPQEYAQLKWCKSDVFGLIGYRQNESINNPIGRYPVIYRINVRDEALEK